MKDDYPNFTEPAQFKQDKIQRVNKRKRKQRRGRPTSYAFRTNRHQRPSFILNFPESMNKLKRPVTVVILE